MPVYIKDLKFIDKWGESLENQVIAYEKEPIRKGEIVFYGPSNFTRWKNVKYGNPVLREEIVGASGAPCCINRGFGSSCSEHQLYYYHRMVKPLEPKVLVYSCFGNHEIFGYSTEECWELGQRVVAYAKNDFPELKIYISSANPSRDMTEAQIAERIMFNGWLREFAENTPDCVYVDVFSHKELWDSNMFVADGVHFNFEGYKIYGDIWREALKDELKNY
jgi:DNA-binding transcriptional regulator/RsmH inhibitor MraZ